METRKRFKFKNLNFLVLGLSFKENCADYRNSKSINLINILKQKKFNVDCFDPLIDKKNFNKEFNINLYLSSKNEYYHYQLVGLTVRAQTGELLGIVTDIIETGSNDVYVVDGPAGQILFPAISQVIKGIDLEAGTMSVVVLEGLR